MAQMPTEMTIHVTPDYTELFTDVNRLRLLPGDVVVIKYPGRRTRQDAERIWNAMNEMFPNNKVLILEDGADIGVLSEHGGGIDEGE